MQTPAGMADDEKDWHGVLEVQRSDTWGARGKLVGVGGASGVVMPFSEAGAACRVGRLTGRSLCMGAMQVNG